jgi:5-methylcytosine-specific restriction endonuclease McrBC regulatory subunit McrC
MRVTIPTNYNYYEESPVDEANLQKEFGIKKASAKKLFSSTFEFTSKSSSLEQIQVFGFKNQRNKLEDEEQLILKLYSKDHSEKDKQYFIQTGLFAGVLFHQGCQFNITTAYGDAFLKRMLNSINDIYVNTQEEKASNSSQTDEFQNILAYLFVQSLEKASVLGLPKTYQLQTQRSHKVRGKIDIDAYLKHDFPFQGKLTTSFREQVYIQEIIDVLFLACKKLEKNFGKAIHKKILGIYQLLKQSYSGSYANPATIEKAKNHSVLQNPMFATFKQVLSYAEIILKDHSLVTQNKADKQITHGYLFDISQLFEVYLEKIIRRHFVDWYITGQEELSVYDDMFFKRRMFPDLIMRHKKTGQVIVLDAKFKKMRGEGRDVDRSDFYQIHSYIQYYQPNVLFGGLIYPLSKDTEPAKSHSKALFGSEATTSKFIIDGVFVNESMTMTEIIENENAFLERLEKLII